MHYITVELLKWRPLYASEHGDVMERLRALHIRGHHIFMTANGHTNFRDQSEAYGESQGDDVQPTSRHESQYVDSKALSAMLLQSIRGLCVHLVMRAWYSNR